MIEISDAWTGKFRIRSDRTSNLKSERTRTGPMIFFSDRTKPFFAGPEQINFIKIFILQQIELKIHKFNKNLNLIKKQF